MPQIRIGIKQKNTQDHRQIVLRVSCYWNTGIIDPKKNWNNGMKGACRQKETGRELLLLAEQSIVTMMTSLLGTLSLTKGVSKRI